VILKCEFCKSNVIYTKAIQEGCSNCGATIPEPKDYREDLAQIDFPYSPFMNKIQKICEVLSKEMGLYSYLVADPARAGYIIRISERKLM
jgi:hypothetical protein